MGSSSTAAATVGMVQGALKGLCIDMAVVLEGHTQVKPLMCCISCCTCHPLFGLPPASAMMQDELPEALVGSVRLNHLDLEKAAKLDLQTDAITRK